MRAANQQVQRSINRSLILSKVRREKAVSRVALSRSTGLEKSSVSMIVNDLLRRGLLVQQTQGKVSSASGRRPVDLRINAQYCSFLGIEVQPRHYRACLMDLGGGIIHKEKGEVQISKDGLSGVLAAIFEKLEPRVDALSLAAVSIGIPGYVNPHLGKVYRSVPLGLSDFDFGHPLSPWGAPIWVENDANCCAWAELIDPRPEEARNFLVLFMEYQEANPLVGQEAGISTGFAIVIGGEVYYGSDYASGEFKSLFWRRGHKGQVGIADERLACVQMDPEAYEEYLQEILLHLSPFVSVLDPERVVFCGDAAPSLAHIQQILRGALVGTWIAEKENARRISVSRYKEYGVALGAAARHLVTLFQYPRFSQEGAGNVLDWQNVLDKRGMA